MPTGHIHVFDVASNTRPPSQETQLNPFHTVSDGQLQIRVLEFHTFPPAQGTQLYPFHSLLFGQRQFPSTQIFPAVHRLMQ
mgnify:CR=1 FL=1